MILIILETKQNIYFTLLYGGNRHLIKFMLVLHIVMHYIISIRFCVEGCKEMAVTIPVHQETWMWSHI